MPKICRLLLALATVGALALVPVGCSGNDDGAEGSTSGQGAAEPATEDGSDATESDRDPLAVPEGFPAEIPVYPGDVANYMSDMPNDIITQHNLEVTTGASYEDVVRWYETSLPAGWDRAQVDETDIGARVTTFFLVGHGYAEIGDNALVQINEEEPVRIVTIASLGPE